METSNIIEALAKRLRGARAEALKTNEEAAAALGKSGQTVARIVADPGKAKAADVLELLKIYGKDPQKVWNAAFDEARRIERAAVADHA